ncbi:ABC transporter permease [Sporosarcina sp. A2]|uniref:ABC transporter permease n=1 Tax=Sporosarcina sp. A2 TaxID=3393449 RepID=UPI003D7BB61A
MRIPALIKRILLQIVRDKRTLALLFVAPLLVLTLMNLVFNGNAVNPVLGIENESEQTIDGLIDEGIQVKVYEQVSDVKNEINRNDLDGFYKYNTLTLLNYDPAVAKGLEVKVKQVLNKEVQLQMMGENNTIFGKADPQDAVATDYVYGSRDTEFFDTFSPILVGFFVFFFVFLISGIGLLNEKTTGTLERLLATPIKRGEIVAAYLLGYGLLAIVQTIIVVVYALNVLDLTIVGSVWNVILINVVVALVALSLGMLLSTFASSEFQMIQFIPLVIVPQILFSGIFSIEGMAGWLQMFAKLMPFYYAANALKGVMHMGFNLTDISRDLYILLAFAVVFIILNWFALKKYRRL